MLERQSFKKPRVVITRRLPDSIQRRFLELFDTELNTSDAPMKRRDLEAAVASADVLVPTLTDAIDASLIGKAGPNLKLIANFGVGVNHIDLAAAKAAGIMITNTPAVLTEDTADMCMALILSVSRRFAEGERLLRLGRWGGWSPTTMLGHRVWGKRLGIIGMGRIGQALARRARGFGISVHYHARTPIAEEIREALEAQYWDDLDQMLGQMDIISLNLPLTDKTYRILDRKRLFSLQSHAMVINTARGGLIDEDALADALVQGKIAGAGLDVYEHEPQINPRLLALDNVVLLPHIGSATHESRQAMGERVLINIKSWMDGHPPVDRVIGSY